jgi:hypothetical protein
MTTKLSDVSSGSKDEPIEWLGRAGLVGRGVIYLLIGILALRLAFGHRTQEANQRGALQELAGHSGGFLLVLVLTITLAAYSLWCFAQVIFGVVDKGKKTSARIGRAFAGCVYASFTFTGIEVLRRSGGDKSQADTQSTWSAEVMSHSGGRWAVAVAGLGVIGFGGYLAYKGVTAKFEKHLDVDRMSDRTRTTVRVLGVVGSTARGAVLALSGVFLVQAARTYDAEKAKGLDGALRELADATGGRFLLAVAAIGLIVFGVYGFAEAKWRRTS